MSFIIFWINEMLSPLGLVIGGLLGCGASIIGLVVNYLFAPTDTVIYTAEFIQKSLDTQPIIGLICGVWLIVSAIMLFIGVMKGGLESPIA